MSKRWYVVHAYSGFEKSVQRALEDRIRRAGMQEKFGKILVPTEEVVEMTGRRRDDRQGTVKVTRRDVPCCLQIVVFPSLYYLLPGVLKRFASKFFRPVFR